MSLQSFRSENTRGFNSLLGTLCLLRIDNFSQPRLDLRFSFHKHSGYIPFVITCRFSRRKGALKCSNQCILKIKKKISFSISTFYSKV